MLAPLEGTSDEHKVGAKIFRNAEFVFQFCTAMRFTDETLIQILEVMRTPGGKKLNNAQWQALLKTERSAAQPARANAEQPDESNCYHVCYCWSVITMAAYMLARASAGKARQTLFYAQAVDQALTLIQHASKEEFYDEILKIPSLSSTKRLPAFALWHYGMRVKFTTTLQQPFAVQDVYMAYQGNLSCQKTIIKMQIKVALAFNKEGLPSPRQRKRIHWRGCHHPANVRGYILDKACLNSDDTLSSCKVVPHLAFFPKKYENVTKQVAMPPHRPILSQSEFHSI